MVDPETSSEPKSKVDSSNRVPEPPPHRLGSGPIRRSRSESSTSGTVELDLSRIWSAPHPALTSEDEAEPPEAGAPEGPLLIDDSDEAHQATSAALAEFVASSIATDEASTDKEANEIKVPKLIAAEEQGTWLHPSHDENDPSIEQPTASKRQWVRRIGLASTMIVMMGGLGWWALYGQHAATAVPVVAERLQSIRPEHSAQNQAEVIASIRRFKSPDPPSVDHISTDTSIAATSGERTAEDESPTPGSVPPQKTPISLGEQIEVACKARRGADARSMFRTMVGAEERRATIQACAGVGIDVTVDVEGATADELLYDAKQAYADADYLTTYRLARDSSRQGRSTEALRLMAMAACELKDRDKAEFVLGMLVLNDRKPIISYCRERGLWVR